MDTEKTTKVALNVNQADYLKLRKRLLDRRQSFAAWVRDCMTAELARDNGGRDD